MKIKDILVENPEDLNKNVRIKFDDRIFYLDEFLNYDVEILNKKKKKYLYM